MSHLVFLSEYEAALAEAQIVANVRAWAAANAPEVVSDSGYLRGRNAATGELTESVTMAWDQPTALNDGRYAILKPTEERVAPMPLAAALAGVTAATEITQDEYEAALPVDENYVIPPPPVPYVETFTAEQVVAKFFSAYQIAALQRLEMGLLAANKPLGPQMTAAKNWLEGVMLGWAIDPTPKPAAAFGEPNGVTFESASAEAVAGLQGPNPET